MPEESKFTGALGRLNKTTPPTQQSNDSPSVPSSDRDVIPLDNPPSPASVAKGVGRPNGKRSDPNYQATTVLLRKTTKKRATRLLEDMGEDMKERQDLSELLEKLLSEWVEANS
jgi:hypothetical protein